MVACDVTMLLEAAELVDGVSFGRSLFPIDGRFSDVLLPKSKSSLFFSRTELLLGVD